MLEPVEMFTQEMRRGKKIYLRLLGVLCMHVQIRGTLKLSLLRNLLRHQAALTNMDYHPQHCSRDSHSCLPPLNAAM